MKNFSYYFTSYKTAFKEQHNIEPKMAVVERKNKMSKKASQNMKCAAAAMVAGGIAFAAAKAMTSSKTHVVKKATGKAIKAVGTMIESFQM